MKFKHYLHSECSYMINYLKTCVWYFQKKKYHPFHRTLEIIFNVRYFIFCTHEYHAVIQFQVIFPLIQLQFFCPTLFFFKLLLWQIPIFLQHLHFTKPYTYKYRNIKIPHRHYKHYFFFFCLFSTLCSIVKTVSSSMKKGVS